MTCDRVLVIHQGRRVFEGPTRELIVDARTVRLRLSGQPDPLPLLQSLPFLERVERQDEIWHLRMDPARVPELNRALVENRLDVLELTPLKQRLEDVFIALTGQSQPPAEEREP